MLLNLCILRIFLETILTPHGWNISINLAYFEQHIEASYIVYIWTDRYMLNGFLT